MPAFDAPRDRDDVITIRDEKHWDPHESVRARTVVRAGDEEWVLNQQMLIQPKRGNRKQRRAGGLQRQDADIDIKSQIGAAKRLWVQRMLVDWTFTKDGMPMPISGESMRLLDGSYVDFIYETIMDAQPKDPETEQGEDDEEDEEEGSLFIDNASHSTAGEMREDDEEQRALIQEMMHPTQTPRNYLSKF